MAEYKPTVAVAGLSGSLGGPLIKDLIATGKYNTPIVALGRNVSQYPQNDNVKYIETDINDAESVKAGLKGVDVLIDVLGFIDQSTFIKGVDGSGVKVVVPSNYGNDFGNSKYRPVYEGGTHVPAWKEAAANSGFKLVQFRVGFFMQWYLNHCNLLGLDLENGVFTIPGTGDEELTFTDEGDIAKTLANTLYKPADQIPELVKVGGDVVTYNKVAQIAEKVTGKKLEKKYIPKEKQIATADDFVASGSHEFTGFLQLLLCVHLEKDVSKFDRYDNDSVNPGLWEWTSFESGAQKLLTK